MHIIEGYLPMEWCIIWIFISLIFFVIGLIQIVKLVNESPESIKILTISGILMFLLSFIKLPIINGTYSHSIGNGLSGSIFGPAITSTIAAIVLFFHSIILGYGGYTTLGANIFSIGIVGPFVAYLVFYGFKKLNISPYISIFVAGFLSSIFTCLTAAIQMGLVYGHVDKFLKFMLITQLPFAVIDVIAAIVVFVLIADLYKDSNIFKKELGDFLSLK